MNHTKGSGNVESMITESTEKINKIKLTEEEKKYVTKKYSDYVNIIKHSVNESTDEKFQHQVFKKRKFIHTVVDSLVGESKLLWKPTKLIFHRDGGWKDVRVSVPFNNQSLTLSNYFKREGTHQELFKSGFENFVQEIYGLSKGETYYVYNLYLKEMYTKISNFIKDNMETSKELNEENIIKKYGRKLFDKMLNRTNTNVKFVEKMAKFVEQRWDEVINVTWTYDVLGEITLTVYIDEDDGQPTAIAQHPLQNEIERTLEKEWKLHGGEGKIHLQYKVNVINLNKDTKLRSSVRESINEGLLDGMSYNNYDETIPNESFRNYIDKVVKRMVDKTDINLYMSDYDPWTTSSPWFGDFITPQFPNDKRYKLNISWLTDEYLKKPPFIKYFANELIEAYAFSTRGQIEYFDSEYYKKLKEKVKLLQIPFIEKRRKQKEEYRGRYKINESKKDAKKEEDEIQRAVQDLSRLHNFNTSVSELTREIVNSSPQPLSSEIWDVLENTESNEIEKGDFDSVFRLAQKYNKSNPLKLIKKLKKGTYNPPIIVRYDDKYRLVAGNTRLCTAKAMGINPNVLIIDLNKTYPVDENFKSQLILLENQSLNNNSNYETVINHFKGLVNDSPEYSNRIEVIFKFIKDFITNEGFNVKVLNNCAVPFRGVRTKDDIIICSPTSYRSLGDLVYVLFHEIRHEIQMGKMDLQDPLSGDIEDFEEFYKIYWNMEIDAHNYGMEWVETIKDLVDLPKELYKVSPQITNYPSMSHMVRNHLVGIHKMIIEMKKNNDDFSGSSDLPMVKQHIDKLESFL